MQKKYWLVMNMYTLVWQIKINLRLDVSLTYSAKAVPKVVHGFVDL